MSHVEQSSKHIQQRKTSTLIHAQTATHSTPANKDSFHLMDVLIVSIRNTDLSNKLDYDKKLANDGEFFYFLHIDFIHPFIFK